MRDGGVSTRGWRSFHQNTKEMSRACKVNDIRTNYVVLLMRLPLIRHISDFIEFNDQDFVEETLEVLEHLTEFEGLSESEIDSLGELISNLYGALEVEKSVDAGMSRKEALNAFMKRVQQSIDK